QSSPRLQGSVAHELCGLEGLKTAPAMGSAYSSSLVDLGSSSLVGLLHTAPKDQSGWQDDVRFALLHPTSSGDAAEGDAFSGGASSSATAFTKPISGSAFAALASFQGKGACRVSVTAAADLAGAPMSVLQNPSLSLVPLSTLAAEAAGTSPRRVARLGPAPMAARGAPFAVRPTDGHLLGTAGSVVGRAAATTPLGIRQRVAPGWARV
ncbi:unnamed protein product, partial [Polarella glacialis]